MAGLANPVSPEGDSAHCPQHVYQQAQHCSPTDKPAVLEPAGANSSLISDPCVPALMLPNRYFGKNGWHEQNYCRTSVDTVTLTDVMTCDLL